MEVGAFDGFHWSNTYPLINLGWSGLMFEPAAEFYQMCRNRYDSNLAIEMEQCAIADFCGTTKLFAGGSMTTIAEELIEGWNKVDWIAQQGIRLDNFTMCDVHTLDCRLAEHAFPHEFDLLSIDAEGVDDKVLRGLDLNVWRPSMIIVEMDVTSNDMDVLQRVNGMNAHLCRSGYSQIYSDAINSIYWRNA